MLLLHHQAHVKRGSHAQDRFLPVSWTWALPIVSEYEHLARTGAGTVPEKNLMDAEDQ